MLKKTAEKELGEREAQLSAFFNNAVMGIAWADTKGKYIKVNKYYLSMFGYENEDELFKHTVGEVTHPEDREKTRIAQQKLASGEIESYHAEKRYIRKDGSYFWGEISVSPVIESDGGIKSFIAVISDINERRKAEEALRESEMRFRDLAEMLPEAVFETDTEMNLVYANQRAFDLFGYSKEEFAQGLSGLEMIAPKDRDRVLSNMAQRLNGDEPGTVEYQALKNDGSTFPILFHASSIMNEGELTGLRGVIVDITERKHAEDKLAESLSLLRATLESTTDGILVVDLQGRIIDCNEKFMQIWKFTDDLVEKGRKKDLVAPENAEKAKYHIIGQLQDQKGFISKVQELYSHPTSESFDTLKFKDGRIIERYSLPQYIDGQPVGRVWNFRDITERIGTERSLKESEEKFRTITEQMTGMVYLTDMQGTITYVSPVAETIFGFRPDEMQGHLFTEFLSEKDIAKAVSAFKNTIAKGKPTHNIELRMKRKDGVVFVGELNGAIYQKEGIAGTIGLIHDITERKQLEQQLQIRDRMDSIGTLASGIAHDFNNLLAGIMGYLDLIRMDSDNLRSDQVGFLDESYELCKKSARLINNIQSLSKVNVSEFTAIDVNVVAREVFSILSRTTDRLIDKQIDIDPGVINVLGQFDQLHQVFLNLGTNAIQALEEKGVQPGDYIRISAAECTSDEEITRKGSFIHIIFEDTGCGMPEEVKRRAFEPLFTTKGLGTQKGQGLGLAMVYNIITRNHNGYIDIETKQGEGTKFHIFLPKATAIKSSEVPETASINGGNETILIIEDEEKICAILKDCLLKFGYSVLSASDGKAGLNLYKKKQNSIDLVILDLSLPRMSGKTVFENIKDIDPSLKVIISSGHSEKEVKKNLRPTAFLAKPFTLDNLVKAVRNSLDQ